MTFSKWKRKKKNEKREHNNISATPKRGWEKSNHQRFQHLEQQNINKFISASGEFKIP